MASSCRERILIFFALNERRVYMVRLFCYAFKFFMLSYCWPLSFSLIFFFVYLSWTTVLSYRDHVLGLSSYSNREHDVMIYVILEDEFTDPFI